MSSSKPEVAAIVGEAEWLAHRFDAVSDAIQFVRVDRETHRKATFLTDEFLPAATQPRVVGRKEAISGISSTAPVHFIFHSAYCCSTLLAGAFDIEGVSFGLKEPSILNDISGWRRRGARPAEVAGALGDALSLLSRPFSVGEQIVIKPSNVINALAPAMIAMAPSSRALFLYTPLPNYLASIAKKGMWGRLWVRELFVKLNKDGLTDYGFTDEETLQQTDLQIAALGWLAQHRLFASVVDRFGEKRIRTLDSELLLAKPHAAMSALVTHFGLDAGPAVVSTIVGGPLFKTHSKTGADFGTAARIAEHDSSSQMHSEEIQKILVWTRAVADAAGQDINLPASLI